MLKQGYSFGGWLPRALLQGEDSNHQLRQFSSSDEHERWMHHAFLKAMDHIGLSSPNPTVGCTLVKENKLLAKGATLSYGDLHGERHAINLVENAKDIRNATAYVMLEPCHHTGKQPPCTKVLKESGIIACHGSVQDPNPLVQGKGFAYLRDQGIKTSTGVLRSEAIAWNYPFFVNQIYGRPMIAAKWAQSIDGCFGDDLGNSKWISSPSSRSYTHWLRQKYDAIVVGSQTVISDQPALTVRNCAPPINRHPLKVIIDPRGVILKTGPKIWQDIRQKTYSPPQKVIHVLGEACKDSISKLKDCPNVKVIYCQESNFCASLIQRLSKQDITRFWGRPIASLMVEGGPNLISHFANAGLIDVYHTFINTSFLYGQKLRLTHTSPPLCHQRDRNKLLCAIPLEHDVLLEYLPEDRYQKIFCPSS